MFQRKAVFVILIAFVFGAVMLPGTLAQTAVSWTAQYYDNSEFQGNPVATETGIASINFSWGESAPSNINVPSDNFSIRYTATPTFAAGTYEFVVSADDGLRVLLDGVPVFDRIGGAYNSERFTQNISAGTHSLVVEYVEQGGEARVQFQYYPLTTQQPIATQPGGIVFPGVTPFALTPAGPVFTPTPSGPQATIFYVRGLALRTGPYLGATYITGLGRETTYTVTGKNYSEGVYPWFRLTTPDGRTGWSSGRYLQLSVGIEQIPDATSIFDEIGGAPNIGVTGTARSTLNVRVGPSERAVRISQIGYGETFEIIGRTVQARKDQWYHIRRGNGEVGWVTAEYVTEFGPVHLAPIR
jgi:hypothetical protein